MIYKTSGKNSNGIEFAGRNRITIKNKVIVSTKLMIIQFLLIVLGVYGALLSFISGMGIEVDEPLLFAAIFFISLMFYIFFRIPGAVKFCIPVAALIYLYAGYEFWREIENGFWHIENYIIARINDYYNLNLDKFLVDDFEPIGVVTIFLVFIIPLISFLACAAISRNTLRFLFIIITMPMVFSSFIVGYIPASYPFAAYLICIICIVGMGTTLKEKHKMLSRKSLRETNKLENRLLEQNFKYIIGFKVGVILSCILLVLLVVTSIVLSPLYPKQTANIAALKQQLQSKVTELAYNDTFHYINSIQVSDFNLFPSVMETGGLSQGQFKLTGEVSFNFDTALKVEAPDLGTSIYLKGYAGSVYEDSTWKELKKEDKEAYQKIEENWEDSNFAVGDQSGYFLSLINGLSTDSYSDLKFNSGKVKVDSINADRQLLYVPYFSLFGNDSPLDLNREEYILPDKKTNTYTFHYFNTDSDIYDFNEEKEYEQCLQNYDTVSGTGANINNEEKDILKKLQEYRVYETEYRNYVYSTYLQVPEKGLDKLKSEFADKDINYYKEKYGDKALSTLVTNVRNRIQEDTSYSLNPGTLPKGKDIIEYFLYENKKGYCSHYASAAAMIFRMKGVPARYVEGYIVKLDDINKGEMSGYQTVVSRINGDININSVDLKTVDVADANAHAWVEIYIDGFGWVPVEVTPSAITEGNNELAALNSNTSREDKDNSSNEENSGSTKEEDQAEKNGETKEEQAEKENSTTQEEQSLENSREDDSDASRANGNTNTNNNSGSEISKNYLFYLQKAGRITLLSTVLLAGILCVILLRYLLITNRRKLFQNKPGNLSKRVLLRFHDVNKILEYKSIDFNLQDSYKDAAIEAEKAWQSLEPGSFQRFVDIALKAKFSRDFITEAELKEAEEFYRNVIIKLYENKSPLEKLYLKFIKLFHT